VLDLQDLCVEFRSQRGAVRVVDRVNLSIGRGEIVGLIGESGSGKTLTALAILGLLPKSARLLARAIRLGGRSLLDLSDAERRALRGDRVALIPQDALGALNPLITVGDQVGEPYILHRKFTWKAARKTARALLSAVHIRDPDRSAREFPHQYSGGMRQRAMVAMGLALEPELLIADEPTTALDVTVQAQILTLLREIRKARGTSILFISHDLAVIAGLCDRLYVMYAGAVIEHGDVADVFARPSHPYTRALLRATPTLHSVQEELISIRGQIPLPGQLPTGCRFADRCGLAFARCSEEPRQIRVSPGHCAACWRCEQTT
jgi:oligopeptide/dipeptide ABC transporter ATP-binding protein